MEFDVPTLRVADDVMLDYLRGNLRLTRTSRGILIQGLLHASVAGECVRCLADTSVLLEIPLEDIYVYPPEPSAEFTVADDGILDLTPLVREEAIAGLPIGVLCRPDCAGLCPNCGQNLNEGPCDCEKEPIDPRFAALRSLKDDLSDNTT